MEFKILGPLEVSEEDSVLPLRGRRQRALLAILILHANEVVPSERLIAELWGDDAPDSGVTALQVRVSQLRRSLDARGASGDVILTQQPGYLLRAGPDSIDARRFEQLLAEGRSLVAEGEPGRAAEILREALGLWRGPALADFAYESFAQTEAARLEELRLAALEERLGVDLILGGHADVVEELEALAAEYPLRERVRAQLMLALYRSGRQADALAVYRETRAVLVEQLGIEPGEELRRLEQAMLRQDPDLAAPPRSRPRAPEARAAVAEERKVVTVVFADLVESTQLTLSGDPERTRSLLDRFYDGMAFEIDTAGGTVEKFVGDAVIAVFGAPVAQEDHAERALHAALAMKRRVHELFGDQLALRIGVATGEVVVGRAREGGSFVTGPAVNAAERLERAASPGELLVATRTTRAAGAAFELGPRIVVEAKGFPGGIESRSLIRALSLTHRRGAGGLEATFVGRELELEVLRTTYRHVAGGGRPFLLTVVGDAGVGKSRLLREWWDWLAEQSPTPLRRTSRCFPLGKRITFGPLRDVLQEELGLLLTDTGDVARRRLGKREILGLTLGLDVAPDLHPLAARERLREAWVDFLAELVSERPVVLLVEDIHWAQDLLIELLELAVRDVRGPLMIVATARPELLDERPAWSRGQRDASTIWLEPLSPEQTDLLLEQLLGTEPPASVRNLLVERSEGNPFFAEELLGRLVDEGVAVRSDAGWVFGELAVEPGVPDSVQSVVAARLDLLPPAEKAAIQAAAVIGRVFWRGALRELLGGELPDVNLLERRDFIRRRSTSAFAGEREFAFKHALIREVAYAGIPKARRARLHAAFAGWLELTTAWQEAPAPLLAHHYAEAVRAEDADLAWQGDPEALAELSGRACTWLRRAAQLAIGRYEIDEGVELLHRALGLEQDDGRRSELWTEIGHANALKFDGEAFWTAMEHAVAVCHDRRTCGEAYGELAYQAFLRSGMWVKRPTTETIESWVERALELSEPGSRARARALVASAFAEPLSGLPAAEEATAIAEALDDPVLRAAAWDAQHYVARASGDYQRACEWGSRRLGLLDSITDPDLRADILQTPLTTCVAVGRFDSARELARRNDEATRALTPHHRMHGVAGLVEVEELLGGWAAIRELEGRVRDTVAANAATPCTRNSRTLLVSAVAAECLGDQAAARRLEESAESLGLPGRHVLDTPRLRLALLRNDHARAEELVSILGAEEEWYARGEGSSMATLTTRLDALAALGRRDTLERDAPALARPGFYPEPFALRALGIVREDESLVEQALARFEALGLDWHAQMTRAILRRTLGASV